MLSLLGREQTVSSLWDQVKESGSQDGGSPAVPFDWFILALDFLFALGTIEVHRGILQRRQT